MKNDLFRLPALMAASPRREDGTAPSDVRARAPHCRVTRDRRDN